MLNSHNMDTEDSGLGYGSVAETSQTSTTRSHSENAEGASTLTSSAYTEQTQSFNDRFKRILRRKCIEHAPQELRERIIEVIKHCTIEESIIYTESTQIRCHTEGENISHVTVTRDTVCCKETSSAEIVLYKKTQRIIARIYRFK